MSSLSFSSFEFKLNAKFIAAIQLLVAHFDCLCQWKSMSRKWSFRMTCWLLLNEAAATFCWLTVWWAVDEPVGSWTRLVPNYWERQNYGSMWRSLLALAWWKSARKAKDCLSFRERISMSCRQRLVFLESVPSFVRCFSCALGPPNTGCHRKQTNIHLFH